MRFGAHKNICLPPKYLDAPATGHHPSTLSINTSWPCDPLGLSPTRHPEYPVSYSLTLSIGWNARVSQQEATTSQAKVSPWACGKGQSESEARCQGVQVSLGSRFEVLSLKGHVKGQNAT